eukprot:Tamp_18172.p2 GENE.Tamp_18172~~Tamp_18172.p2  ORF type:complete len:192 (-),score=43.07 Tamp_18172:334-909(-)
MPAFAPLPLVLAGAFSVGGDFGRAVNFSVASVPDSLLQQGAFAKHFERGALVGELVTIEPSAEVEIVGGMAVDIPILDQTAQTDAAACLLILANTNMLAIDDISDVEEFPTSMGTCVKGEIGGCSCATNVTHFSTFAVVDQTVAFEKIPDPVGDTIAEDLDDASPRTHVSRSWATMAILATLSAFASVSMQ